MIKFKPARAHAGNLVHAVPVGDADKIKNSALCGKDARHSRRPVWYVMHESTPITCAACVRKMPHQL